MKQSGTTATGFSRLIFALLLMALSGLLGAAQAQNAGQPGATDDEDIQLRQTRMIENPISPPDTTSPRATLESFLLIMHQASAEWIDIRDSYFDGDTLFLTNGEKTRLIHVSALLEKAMQTFDLSEIPATARDRVGIEIVLQAQEILDRIYLPDLEDVPGDPAGDYTAPAQGTELPSQWILPGTSLIIARQDTGEQSGQYLFSASTVSRIPSDYEIIKALPLQADRGEDLYSYYIYTPGDLVAPRWYEYILKGPDWPKRTFAGQAYWQWLALALLSAFYIMALGLYARWRRSSDTPEDEPRDKNWTRVVAPAVVILAANLFRSLCENDINITGPLMQAIATATSAGVWAASAWLTYQALQLLYDWTLSKTTITSGGLDSSLLRTGFRVVSFAISTLIVGYGATRVGIPIYGVVAGLGVGGLAIALAAQPTIENLIGGIILYADRIVRVGDFCQFDDLSGTVEEIGIRSTRIRALDRTLITIANADLAKRKITNFSQRDVFLFRHKLGLTYETDNNTILGLIAAIRERLEAHPAVLAQPLRVRLVEYGDFAINLDVYANVAAFDMNAFLAVQEELLIDIRAIIDAHGSDLALPASQVYLKEESQPKIAAATKPPTDSEG